MLLKNVAALADQQGISGSLDARLKFFVPGLNLIGPGGAIAIQR